MKNIFIAMLLAAMITFTLGLRVKSGAVKLQTSRTLTDPQFNALYDQWMSNKQCMNDYYEIFGCCVQTYQDAMDTLMAITTTDMQHNAGIY